MILFIILDNQLPKELKKKEEPLDKQQQLDKLLFIKDKELIHMLKLTNREQQYQEDLWEHNLNMKKDSHKTKDLKRQEDWIH